MSSGEEITGSELKSFMKAIQDQFAKLNRRIDDLESPSKPRMSRRHMDEEEEDDESVVRGSRRGQRVERKQDNHLGSIKMKIPAFQGKNDPELYLEWERRVEHIFDCHNYSEEKKVKLAAVEFTDYASIWWDQFVLNRKRYGERPINSWEEMKVVMRKRFIPNHYYRDLCRKLQGLKQDSLSVEEYYQEMEKAMIRANVEEDREATMARFIGGLNSDIVDLQHYVEMEELLHKSIKVEQQLKSRGKAKYSSSSGSSWKSDWKENKTTTKTEEEVKTKEFEVVSKGNPDKPSVRSRDIRCFKRQGHGHVASQCPNRRVMIVKGNGEIESASSDDDMPPLEDCSDVDIIEPVKGDLLVNRRILNMQPQVDVNEEQRDNIFHTRCHINDKVCSMIIDSGSCTNVVSTLLISKLNLKTLKHPNPYKLQWLSECGEIKVTKRALITFSIGKYHDEVLCDVVPMQASHILLGRPWQYDRKATHDGFKNQYSFNFNKRKVVLTSLKPIEAYEDQKRIAREFKAKGDSLTNTTEGSGTHNTLMLRKQSLVLTRVFPSVDVFVLQAKDLQAKQTCQQVYQYTKKNSSNDVRREHNTSLPQPQSSGLHHQAKIRGRIFSKEGGNDMNRGSSAKKSGSCRSCDGLHWPTPARKAAGLHLVRRRRRKVAPPAFRPAFAGRFLLNFSRPPAFFFRS